MNMQSKSLLRMGVSVGTAVFLFLALFAALNTNVLAAPTDPLANDIRISQVFGGGGNSGSVYTNDFIELFNSGSTTIDLTGWSVQYASSSGTSWQTTALVGTLAPGQYYLIKQAQGSGGTTPLPTSDVTGSIAMSGSNGKVALVDNSTALSGSCPSSVIDFVGYGSANCYEGSDSTPSLSSTTAAIRHESGCTDTDDNAADFTASTPTPRNTSSPTHSCSTGSVLAMTKSVEPQTAVPYQSAVTYTVILENSGSVSDTNVLFTDTLPISTTFNSWIEQPIGATEAGNEITWTGTVTNGESITFTFTADQTGDYGDIITNTAEFSGTTSAGTAQADFTVESLAGDITFVYHDLEDVVLPGEAIYMVGDFNSWDITATPMIADATNDVFTATVSALSSGDYDYKYIVYTDTVPTGLAQYDWLNTDNHSITVSGNATQDDYRNVTVGWANLQWPSTLETDMGTATNDVYGRLYIQGVTNTPGDEGRGLKAEVGYGDDATLPSWDWFSMVFNADDGASNDEFVGVMTPTLAGVYSYTTRFDGNWGSGNPNAAWTYADLNGIPLELDQTGVLTVNIVTVPIATARAGSVGETFAISGTVTYIPDTFSFAGWALQDASGGIAIFDGSFIPTVEYGDSVQIIANRGAYNGEEQLTAISYYNHLGSGPEVTPIVTTTNVMDSGSVEGWIVEIQGTISDLSGCTSNYSFEVDDGSGPVTVYVDKDTGVNVCDMGGVNGGEIRVVGFATEFRGAHQLKPRRLSDIDLGILQITKEAPQLVAPGELFTYTLTVNNQTGDTLTNLVISDVVPTNTTFAYALDSGVESGGIVTWDIANLAHANDVSVQFAVTAANSTTSAVNDTYAAYASNHITPVTGLPTTTYFDEQLHIYHVQGEGFVSPLVGQEVTVSGEVIADFQGNDGMRGFFIQDSVGDGNMLTSDGIFVYDYYLDPSVDVNVGDIVTVTGDAAEYQNNTQISNVSTIVTETNTLSIAPTIVTLPETTKGDLEQYEGMFVTLPQTMTVSQNYFQGQFGQVSLSANGRLFQPTNVYTPTSTEAVDLADSNARNYLILDDGSTAWNPEPVPYIGISGTLRAGDTTNGLVGVLDEGSISSQTDIDYRLQPLSTVTFDRINDRTSTPEDVGGRFQIASFNVLNYFTTIGSSEICGPNQDLECRGADTDEEFIRQRTKIITAIVSIDAHIVGLMEIENNETAATTDLVDGLNAEVGTGTYAFIDTGYIGGDAIKVAMIYQPSKVTPVGTTAVLTDVFPFNTNTRPPLAQAFVENDTGHEFIVVVNHFKSKGSSCDYLGDPDLGDGQGNCNLTRVEAANELVAWLDTDPTGTGDSDIFIIGDLNSYAQEDPITALKGHGYTNLIEQFTGPWAYSYIFNGQSGYLDHALASSSAQSAVTGVTEWHINADEPAALDYNNYNWADLYKGDPYRASDHDPVLIGVSLKWIQYMPIVFKN